MQPEIHHLYFTTKLLDIVDFMLLLTFLTQARCIGVSRVKRDFVCLFVCLFFSSCLWWNAASRQEPDAIVPSLAQLHVNQGCDGQCE